MVSMLHSRLRGLDSYSGHGSPTKLNRNQLSGNRQPLIACTGFLFFFSSKGALLKEWSFGWFHRKEINEMMILLVGRWVLPCASCDDVNSCYWREAVWAPYSCHYNVLSRDDTRTCLANKKVRSV